MKLLSDIFEFIKTGNIKDQKNLSELKEGDILYFARIGDYTGEACPKVIAPAVLNMDNMRYKKLKHIYIEDDTIMYVGDTGKFAPDGSLKNENLRLTKLIVKKYNKVKDKPYSIIRGSMYWYIISTSFEGIKTCVSNKLFRM